MSTPLRSRALQVIFGGGVGGTLAQSLVEWFSKQVSEALGGTPEVLDVSKLKPGETYHLTVRPPMSKSERSARARRDKLAAKLESATAPSGSTLRTARRLARTQRQLERSPRSARRVRKLEAREQKLGRKFDAATKLSPRQQRQRNEIERLDATIASERESSLAALSRVPRRRSTRVLP